MVERLKRCVKEKHLFSLCVIINPCLPLFSIITNMLLHHYWDGHTWGTIYNSTDNTPVETKKAQHAS